MEKPSWFLMGGRFFVESVHRGFLKKLAADPEVKQCLISAPTAEGLSGVTFHKFDSTEANQTITLDMETKGSNSAGGGGSAGTIDDCLSEILKLYEAIDAEEEDNETEAMTPAAAAAADAEVNAVGSTGDADALNIKAIGIEGDAADGEGEDSEDAGAFMKGEEPKQPEIHAIEVKQSEIERL